MKIRNPEVMAEFRRRRGRQWIASGVILAIFLPIIIRRDRGNISVFGLSDNVTTALLLGIVLVMLAFSLKNWRCPQCNRYLGKRINPGYCSHCGVQLRD